jgi:hypothetical protein
MVELAAWVIVIVLGPAALMTVLWIGWKVLPYLVAACGGLVTFLSLDKVGGSDNVGLVAGLVTVLALLSVVKRWDDA